MTTEYVARTIQEIGRWEEQQPSWLANVGDFILLPAQKVAEALIPQGALDAVAKTIEGFLIGASAVAEHLFDANGIRARVLARVASMARSPSMPAGQEDSRQAESWTLEAADLEAQAIWNWHLGYATVEGAAIGAAGLLGLAADIPALFTLVFREILEIATCYGYDGGKPEERDYAVHLLQVASATDHKSKMAALIALKQLEVILVKVSWKRMAAAAAAKEISRLSALATARQFAKSIGVNLTKRKALQAVPVVGAVIGASFNATYANDVGRAAYMSYRRRWIAEHEPPPLTEPVLSGM